MNALLSSLICGEGCIWVRVVCLCLNFELDWYIEICLCVGDKLSRLECEVLVSEYVYYSLFLGLIWSWTWFGVSYLLIKIDCKMSFFVDWGVITPMSIWWLCLYCGESDANSLFVLLIFWKKRFIWLFVTRLLLRKSWFVSSIRLLLKLYYFYLCRRD